jgi:peroxiredoxin
MEPGDTVEDFELVDEAGTPRRLSTLLDDGPVPGGLHTRRMTFVIGQDRRLVDVVASETQFDRHGDEALEIGRKHRSVA